MEADLIRAVNRIRDELDQVKERRIRAEVRLEQLQKQKNEILKEIERMGLSPEALEGKLEEMKKEISELMEKAKKLLPEE